MITPGKKVRKFLFASPPKVGYATASRTKKGSIDHFGSTLQPFKGDHIMKPHETLRSDLEQTVVVKSGEEKFRNGRIVVRPQSSKG